MKEASKVGDFLVRKQIREGKHTAYTLEVVVVPDLNQGDTHLVKKIKTLIYE